MASGTKADSGPRPVPRRQYRAADFVSACLSEPDALIYFLFNVGDGESQLLLLPQRGDFSRQALIVDVATTRKVPAFLEALASSGILKKIEGRIFPIVVATQPRDDHIGGLPEFLDRFGPMISEFWESGYYRATPSFVEMMRALEDNPGIGHVQPGSGTTRFFGNVKVTVLGPSTSLRNRFDSYGVQPSDASLILQIKYPAGRIAQDGANRHYLRLRDPWSIILGADAQGLSWGQVSLEFPALKRLEASFQFRELRSALGGDPLKAQVLKIPHHFSMHSMSIDILERIQPWICLVSCSRDPHSLPHPLALEGLREVLQPSKVGRLRRSDYALGLNYTCDLDDGGQPLGSIALILPPSRAEHIRVWRFGDRPEEGVRLETAREQLPPR